SSATRLSNDCPIYVARRRWTIGNNIGDPACKSARYGRRLWSAVDRFTLLSRRQHRFESGRGRQGNQQVRKRHANPPPRRTEKIRNRCCELGAYFDPPNARAPPVAGRRSALAGVRVLVGCL